MNSDHARFIFMNVQQYKNYRLFMLYFVKYQTGPTPINDNFIHVVTTLSTNQSILLQV